MDSWAWERPGKDDWNGDARARDMARRVGRRGSQEGPCDDANDSDGAAADAVPTGDLAESGGWKSDSQGDGPDGDSNEGSYVTTTTVTAVTTATATV